ncbi:glycosyltransferase family 4 protein [Lysobacter sp. GCM10012299]|uniref:glycosyltransferase family 4 protein n=1 Tax=Lysobacter sp. GCM10012299 TaxID=3317333 RepID=UPI003619DB1F
MRVAVITTRTASGEVGGAERFFDALRDSFRAIGHEADEIAVTVDESNFEQIKRSYLKCYDLDLSAYDMVVSTKAPTWMVRHERHVSYLVHTIRVFYDMFEDVFPSPAPSLLAERELVHRLDTGALAFPRCRALFTIGEEVSRRLREYNGLESKVLHPPLWSDVFKTGKTGDYLFLPGRLHPWKRVDLAIRAMRHVKAPIRLLISGTGEAESELRALAAGDPRIEFLGRVSDEDLTRLYSDALGVMFVPKREDYGYVTLEAFASGKPVVTCADSGEAAALVVDGSSGMVTQPDERDLASAIERLAASPQMASSMGAVGEQWVRTLSWPAIARQLVEAAMK